MDRTRLLLVVFLAGASACEGEIQSRALEWVAPLEQGDVPAGDAIEVAVATANPEARVMRFSLDGQEVGACDPSQAEEDCRLGNVWRWTIVIPAMGSHRLEASFDSSAGPIAIARTIDVVAPPSEAELAAAEIDTNVDLAADPYTPNEEAATINRGTLDPNRAYHDIFGGIFWRVYRQRVILHSGTPMGSVSAAAGCMRRYGASIRHWADHYGISRGSVVATALTESSCTDPRGSSDGLSSGPMQVTASTCAALTGLSRSTCRVRMYTHPDFSFEVGIKYMASSYQRSQHHRDPPKIAAAYNAGSLRRSSANRWHMLTTGNHIDRFVRAYNAYRKWEAQHGVPLLVAQAEPSWSGEHVARAEELPQNAAEGQVVFVGDFAEREGEFWQVANGQWQPIDNEE
jgi:Transglycosylase SLT domain